jgi:hypothetical protein
MIDMSKIALASINSFAYIEGKADSSVQPSEDLLITLTYGQLRELITQAVQEATKPILQELQDLRARQDALELRISCREVQQQDAQPEIEAVKAITTKVAELEALQTLFHGPAPAQEDRPGLAVAFARRREALDGLPARVFALEEDLATLEKRIRPPRERPPAPGSKTEARIAKIEEILKERGPTTFKGIERILDISPREMLRITKRLDLRRYEISRRPGDARQKLIKLRAQIR